MDKISDFISKLCQSLLSMVKIVLQSNWRTRLPRPADSSEIVILGNGPSLNDTIAQSPDFLKSRQMLAVNFAACAEQFMTLKPEYYVLADPHFFRGFDQPNVVRLWDTLTKRVDWDITLFIPAKFRKAAANITGLTDSRHVKVAYYNLTPIEGFAWLENMAFKTGLGMPRPRNVLIPSLMLALGMGFKTIWLAGADHSWTRTLSVDDNNCVVSIQPHFYKEDDKELKRVNTEYMRYPLHQIMYSFYVAFRSYFTIYRYARHIGSEIFNITPGSFIDAFPRKKITQ